jgi:hypothetical protein
MDVCIYSYFRQISANKKFDEALEFEVLSSGYDELFLLGSNAV